MKLKQLFEVKYTSGRVLVVISGEMGDQVVEMSKDDVERIKKLMTVPGRHALEDPRPDEYPEEVNEILDRARPIEVVGTVGTAPDNWGWHET